MTPTSHSSTKARLTSEESHYEHDDPRSAETNGRLHTRQNSERHSGGHSGKPCGDAGKPFNAVVLDPAERAFEGRVAPVERDRASAGSSAAVWLFLCTLLVRRGGVTQRTGHTAVAVAVPRREVKTNVICSCRKAYRRTILVSGVYGIRCQFMYTETSPDSSSQNADGFSSGNRENKNYRERCWYGIL